jgi:dihydroorotase
MPFSLLLRGVQLLVAPDRPARIADVLIVEGRIVRIGDGQTDSLRDAAGSEAPRELEASTLWLGPALVDPHSVLEDPLEGRAETLVSLREAAAAGGYGTVALLPWALGWRDRPERLDPFWPEPMRLPLWGSFSLDGLDAALAPHADQLAAGALGLAGGEALPPLALLERGLRLGETDDRPVLLAPRDVALTQGGFVRERVETLRAGWPPDPSISEALPLQSLLTLASAMPGSVLRLMNLSTAEAVDTLRQARHPPPASVCWWHLIADSGLLDPADEGWRLVPSLGGPVDREALIGALAENLITCVAVQHQALDAEERLLPVDQRRPGLAGHGVVLPLLWHELVEVRGWSPERLWQVLCWGGSSFLALPAERLEPGSRRWILFDPLREWTWGPDTCPSLAANQPCWQKRIRGAVIASGLIDPSKWRLPGAPSSGTERSARRPGR